jgi:membrane fusion protein, copper/silver efflux system
VTKYLVGALIVGVTGVGALRVSFPAHDAHTHGALTAPTVSHPSRANAMRLDRKELERVGVTTAAVRPTRSVRTIRTSGRVEVDEDRVFPVRAGGGGTVADLVRGTETGSLVRVGQPLMSAYGRDYTTAQRTFLYALRAAEGSSPTFTGQPQNPNAVSLEEARRDLRSMGFDAQQIARLERTREVTLDVTIKAPATGAIISRNVFREQRFDSGAELFRIADLTHVWVAADIAAADDAYIHPDAVVKVAVPGRRDTSLRAVMSKVLPTYDVASRTGRIRLDVDNPRLLLRPGMFVDVAIQVVLPQALTVPTEAIVEDGLGQTVFVQTGDGVFEPRTIQTGWRFDGIAEVLRGLAPEESIVVTGSFLLQSEYRIRHGTPGLHD